MCVCVYLKVYVGRCGVYVYLSAIEVPPPRNITKRSDETNYIRTELLHTTLTIKSLRGIVENDSDVLEPFFYSNYICYDM